jgi:putative tryptophan/tyrosine transport system substrate-binding protein
MKRRTFLAYALTSAGLPKIAAAQTPAKRFRVGWIVATSAATSAVFFDAFRAGLSDRGYVVGDNLILEARYGDGVTDRVPALTQELLRIPVDVIVTQGPTTWTIVKSVTTTPVVYVFSADPVEAGFAQSFARPGGNSTGLTLMSVELNGKRLELLREILPRCSAPRSSPIPITGVSISSVKTPRRLHSGLELPSSICRCTTPLSWKQVSRLSRPTRKRSSSFLIR